MIIYSKFSLNYLISGLISSLLISFFLYQKKLINKETEYLYLSFGFYKYFVQIYFQNFGKSILYLFSQAFKIKNQEEIIEVKLNLKNLVNIEALFAGINLFPGILALDFKEKNILKLYLSDERYLKNIDLNKFCKNFDQINDDNLV